MGPNPPMHTHANEYTWCLLVIGLGLAGNVRHTNFAGVSMDKSPPPEVTSFPPTSARPCASAPTRAPSSRAPGQRGEAAERAEGPGDAGPHLRRCRGRVRRKKRRSARRAGSCDSRGKGGGFLRGGFVWPGSNHRPKGFQEFFSF